MPELPEVETIVRSLREGGRGAPSILGKEITRAEVYWDKTVESPDVNTFRKRIVGQNVLSLSRRAKYIIIELSQDSLLIHLRMSGDILVGESTVPLGKYSRMAIYFKDGFQLSFDNPRKFGRVWLTENPMDILQGLGPEPLEESLDNEQFYSMLNARKRIIKPLLMDQKFIAGIGNIYADEALIIAKIHPLRRANTLTPQEAKSLLKALRAVLLQGIRQNGASIDWAYKGGGFQNDFRVYQRTDEPCFTCGTPISRIVVGQRGTHFCPTCQVNEVT